MLRDVREQLKADALAKLKLTCPTLFAMGWFKVIFWILFCTIKTVLCRRTCQNLKKNWSSKRKNLTEKMHKERCFILLIQITKRIVVIFRGYFWG